MAIAQAENQSYVVLLQSGPDEYDALHEQVFLPALDAYAPIGATAEATEAVAIPYTEEAVTFPGGADNVTLAGTLSAPSTDGPHPAVVLISGSGPQDRDETIAGTQMKPFALLADALARAGIAVLRYDDRGVGGSTGVFDTALTSDFTADAAAAIAFLETRPDINRDQIGVIGHSEGGVVTAALGAQNLPDFIISLAGTSVPGTDLLLQQNRRLLEAEGTAQSDIDAQIALLEGIFPLVLAGDLDGAMDFVRETAVAVWPDLDAATQAQFSSVDEFVVAMEQTMRAQFGQPWLISFLGTNPADDWAETTVPVLGLFGALDVQVDAEQNAGPMQAALDEAGNEDVSVVVLPDANHLFQAAKTGAVSEYGSLPPEFTPELIPTILDWLLARVTVAQ
jgi:pimeloyl-ACP methyl ester carboxylesterase